MCMSKGYMYFMLADLMLLAYCCIRAFIIRTQENKENSTHAWYRRKGRLCGYVLAIMLTVQTVIRNLREWHKVTNKSHSYEVDNMHSNPESSLHIHHALQWFHGHNTSTRASFPTPRPCFHMLIGFSNVLANFHQCLSICKQIIKDKARPLDKTLQ